jgi:hypothetical protein
MIDRGKKSYALLLYNVYFRVKLFVYMLIAFSNEVLPETFQKGLLPTGSGQSSSWSVPVFQCF